MGRKGVTYINIEQPLSTIYIVYIQDDPIKIPSYTFIKLLIIMLSL